jgi:hypothetical protein
MIPLRTDQIGIIVLMRLVTLPIIAGLSLMALRPLMRSIEDVDLMPQKPAAQ